MQEGPDATTPRAIKPRPSYSTTRATDWSCGVTVVVTNGPALILLSANTPRQRLLPDKYADGCVTVQLRQLMLGHLKDANLLDKNGQKFWVLDASFKGIDFAAYRPLGVFWAIVTFVGGVLTLTCFVKAAIRTEHTKSLSLDQAKEWLIGLVQQSPQLYSHSLSEELVVKIRNASKLNNLITRWYFN
jgi:hypothetical protein